MTEQQHHSVSTGLGPVVRVPVRGPRTRAQLLLPDADHITMAIQKSGTYYESDLLDALRSQHLHGIFVDVGAHYGNHTVYFALECEAERVVAIEPNPASFDGLLANVQVNGISQQVIALRIAIHPSCERVSLVPMYWQPEPGVPIQARTNSGMIGVAPASGGKGTSAARLDNVLHSFGKITVLKVDIEGLSVEALESAMTILKRDRPVVAVEAASDTEQERLRRLLLPLGYELLGQYCWTPTFLLQASALHEPMSSTVRRRAAGGSSPW
jgi:FkbM family methyltransferase